jgi:hypothetical protein
MNGLDAEKTLPHDASNEKTSSVDDAASSTYNNNDDVEKAQAHDTAREELNGDAASKKEEEKDPNVVDFDGDDDPECALNWTTKKKWTMGALLSAMTFVTFVLPLHFSYLFPIVFQIQEIGRLTMITQTSGILNVRPRRR